MTTTTAGTVRRIARPGGELAVEIWGRGPLVLCLPGMGELRSSFRRTVPALVEAGFTAAAMDLRGHGDSSPTFDRYDDVASGQDALAVLRELGGRGALVGSSMGAGAAAWAAAEDPGAVSGLALLGPFVRNPKANPLLTLALRLAMGGPWAPRVWGSYLPKLYPGTRPDDLDEHVSTVVQSLRRPGYTRSFRATTRTTHAPVEARLGEVAAPTLVVMGTADPDVSDAGAEARWVAERLRGELLLVPGAGHYPHVEVPDAVNPVLVDFLRRAPARA